MHRHRQALRLGGLALLAAGVALVLAYDALVGAIAIGLAAVPLALAQPLLLARLRRRQVRGAAAGNGHAPGTGEEDLDQLA